MDVELWERLEHHAPLERRSVTNLLQKLVADGLDSLDAMAAERARQSEPAEPPAPLPKSMRGKRRPPPKRKR